jgi:hypothetical protein
VTGPAATDDPASNAGTSPTSTPTSAKVVPLTRRGLHRELTGIFMFFALLRKAIRENFPSGPEVLVVFDGETGSAGRKASRASSDAAW